MVVNCDNKENENSQSRKPNKNTSDKDVNKPLRTGKVCNILSRVVQQEAVESDSEGNGSESDDDGFGFRCLINTVSRSQPMTSTQQIILATKELVNSNWILLDNQSTVNIFKSKDLLTDIGPASENIRCYCNGGFQDTSLSGTYEGIGEVYWNDTSLANILSYAELGQKYRITSDSWVEDSFTVHDFQGQDMKFIKSQEGLYYHDVRWKETGIPDYLLKSIQRKEAKEVDCLKQAKSGATSLETGTIREANVCTTQNIILLNTVQENEEGFTKRDLRQAKLAKRLYILLGRPSYRDFANVVKWKLIKNCPVGYSDVVNAWKIYGPDVGSIRGKTTRQKPEVVEMEGIVKIPQELLYQLQDLTLCVDIMYMDKLVIFTTFSRRVGFTTVDKLKSRKSEEIYKSMEKVLALYKHRDVPIKNMLGDREFVPLSDALLKDHDVVFNPTAANEHVGDVERNIRVIKERARASKAALPFEAIPKVMKIANLKLAAFWTNLFPRKGSVSEYFGPRMLLLGEFTDYNKVCKVPFGAYCEVNGFIMGH